MTDIAGASKYYGGPHTISSIPWGDSQISFYRGSDDTIHETFTNDSGGSISGSLGGYVTSDVSAVTWGTTRWDVFYRTSDGSVWQVTNNSGTTTWTPLGGVIMGSPSVVSWGTNRFDVFVRGTDYNLWHQAYDGTWHGWERLPTAGYALGGDPVAVSWGSNRLDVFARAWDGSLLHEWWNGGWGTESLGGKIYGVPAPIVTGSGKLYVYVRGTDDAIWEQSFDGTSWSGYFGPRMGNVLSNPVAGWTGSSTVVGFRGLDPTGTTTALNIYEESPIDWRGHVNWAFGLLLSPHSFSASPSMVQVSTDVDFFVRGTDSALWRLAADTNTDSSTWTWASFGGSLH
jgi:hypothetical protein